jgi:hypothetical protein
MLFYFQWLSAGYKFELSEEKEGEGGKLQKFDFPLSIRTIKPLSVAFID